MVELARMIESDEDEAPKKLERGEVVVAKVLDAAVEEAALVGYAALTLERVAARAGVNRTTIYRRWPTKSALMQAAMHRAASEIDFAIDTGNIRDDLRALLSSAHRGAFGPPTLGLSRVMNEAEDQEVLDLAARFQSEKRRQALDLVQRWADRGELRADLDKEIFFESILGVIHLRVVFQRATLTKAFAERFVEHFAGFAAPHPTKKPAKRRAQRPR